MATPAAAQRRPSLEDEDGSGSRMPRPPPLSSPRSGSGDDQEPRDVAAGGDTPPTPSSSPPLPRGMLPPPVVTVKRGVSIGGAHTVSMGYKSADGGKGHHHGGSLSITGLPMGLSVTNTASSSLLPQQPPDNRNPPSSAAALSLVLPSPAKAPVRRAQSLPRIEDGRGQRLLQAVKNQQRWLVTWILAKSDKELQQLEDNSTPASTSSSSTTTTTTIPPPSSSTNSTMAGGKPPTTPSASMRRSKSAMDALVNEKDGDGRTPLHYAARWGDMEVVQTLIARGAEVRAADAHGHTPADEAEYWGHAAVKEHLRSLELGKDTMERVVEAGDVRGLKELLLRGTDLKALEGAGLLHRAARRGDLAMLRLLLAAGLEVVARDEDGRTAAEAALMSGHLKAFELLSSRGPPTTTSTTSPSTSTTTGGSTTGEQEGLEVEEQGGMVVGPDGGLVYLAKTPLHAAAECGSVAAVLRYGREWPADALDGQLNTPLHCAIMHGHADAARAIVHDLKADVNKRNRWGTTPLAEAVRLGHDEIAAMLRDHGACLFLEIDSQQVIMEPRDQYFLRLELCTSLLTWGSAITPRPALVRFFHATHHNSLLLCCSVRPRLVPDNRSSSSSIRSWGSASEEDFDDASPQTERSKGEEEADAVMSHLVLDDRTWFLREAFRENKPLVVAEAAGRDPNDLFLSPLMAYTQNKHLAVIPLVANGCRRLGAFLLLFKSEAPPKLDAHLVEEVHQIVAGGDKDLSAWLSAPTTDAPRLQLLLQSRWLKQRIKEWVAAVYSQESYNFYNPNRQMCALLKAAHAQGRAIALQDVCQRCPWVQQMVDAVFYMCDVLLPMPPSKPLFALNAECAKELRAQGFRPPDLRSAVDSPVYTSWAQHVRAWAEKGEAMERDLARLQQTALQQQQASDPPSSSSTAPQAPQWQAPVSFAFSHRDVFDLIGKHKYDHTLPDLLTSLADAQGAFPWYERAFAECLATKLAGSGAMRQGAALGVVTHHLYRTFMHPHELPKAWAQLHRAVAHLWGEGRPATAIFVLYKSVLEFLHPFHDGNGRFSRVVASVLLRRAGFPRALIHSENKILSLKEFFDIVTKEVHGRMQRSQQQQAQAQQALQPSPSPTLSHSSTVPSPTTRTLGHSSTVPAPSSSTVARASTVSITPEERRLRLLALEAKAKAEQQKEKAKQEKEKAKQGGKEGEEEEEEEGGQQAFSS